MDIITNEQQQQQAFKASEDPQLPAGTGDKLTEVANAAAQLWQNFSDAAPSSQPTSSPVLSQSAG